MVFGRGEEGRGRGLAGEQGKRGPERRLLIHPVNPPPRGCNPTREKAWLAFPAAAPPPSGEAREPGGRQGRWPGAAPGAFPPTPTFLILGQAPKWPRGSVTVWPLWGPHWLPVHTPPRRAGADLCLEGTRGWPSACENMLVIVRATRIKPRWDPGPRPRRGGIGDTGRDWCGGVDGPAPQTLLLSVWQFPQSETE